MHCREIINFLIEENYINLSGTEYPVLTLNNKSREILFENKTIEMKLIKETSTVSTPITLNDIDTQLFNKLKALRKKIADIESMPAYIIFSDSTLSDMCKKRPKNKEEFLNVSGVGYMKLEKYGDRFLKVINEEL